MSTPDRRVDLLASKLPSELPAMDSRELKDQFSEPPSRNRWAVPLVAALFVLASERAIARINWEPDSILVKGNLPFPALATKDGGPYRVLVSPGGTVFFLWPDTTGDDSDPNAPAESLKFCDGRLAFSSNSRCPSYLDEYNPPKPPPETAPPDSIFPRSCRYYHLPKYPSSLYLMARYPDGTTGPVEMAIPIDPNSLTSLNIGHDAAVGPDGSVHLVWNEMVPNVLLEPAPYSNSTTFALTLPVTGSELMYNRCGVNTDFDPYPDSIAWIIGPDSAACVDSFGAPCDSFTTSLVDSLAYPCWRQLGPLNVICYRRRYPSGYWGPVHRNIANWTDLNNPDSLRTTLDPVISVDSEGWVYVAWAQKPPEIPSCAWRGGSRRGGPGGEQAKGAFNTPQHDCFFRKWDSSVHAEGPDGDDPVIRVTTDTNPFPSSMPVGYQDHDEFQQDLPYDMMVVGSGSAAKVHLLLWRGPTMGVPRSNGVDEFSDNGLYTFSTDLGATWSARKPLTKSLWELYPCPVTGDPYQIADGPGTIELPRGRFLQKSSGPVHVLYAHEYVVRSDSCPGCEYVPGCFTEKKYGMEVFHRQLVGDDPESWAPPYSQFPNRLTRYDTEDSAVCKREARPVGITASDGSLHAFWFVEGDSSCDYGENSMNPMLAGGTHVFHAELKGGQWGYPDTVMSFTSGTDPSVASVEVEERNGIFHLLVAKGPFQVDPLNSEEPAGQYLLPATAALYYKRGMFAPETTAYTCDLSNADTVGNLITWSDSIVLCQDYTVDSCSTLEIEPGTEVIVQHGGDIALTIRGKLLCEGTAAAPIVFRSDRIPERATIGDWTGIRVEGPSARARLVHTKISGAVFGVHRAQDAGNSQPPASCAAADTAVRTGTVWIDSCRIAYNEQAGVQIEGDALSSTLDRLHVGNSELLTNLKGIVVENASADDSSDGGGNRHFVIIGNQIRFNELYGIEIRGKYARKVVVDSNLVQGYGEDEFIAVPDTAEDPIDVGLFYDETGHDGADGDILTVCRNTFYRIEGEAIKLGYLEDMLTGYTKTKTTAGAGATESPVLMRGNFIHRVGTGFSLDSARGVLIRGNWLQWYTTGLTTTTWKPKLGTSTTSNSCSAESSGCNYFVNGDYHNGLWFTDGPPDSFKFHVIAPETGASTDNLFARMNYWRPVHLQDSLDQASCDTSEYFSIAPTTGNLILEPCLWGLLGPPSTDFWNVLQMPLKAPPGGVSGRQTLAPPNQFALYGNFPNPFNPVTNIRYDVPVETSAAELSIYDVQGRRVLMLREGRMRPGRYTEPWDGRNTEGRFVGSGVYFVRLKAGTFDETRKMVLLK